MNRLSPALLLRLASIGAILLALVAALAFTAGWFSPSRLNARGESPMPCRSMTACIQASAVPTPRACALKDALASGNGTPCPGPASSARAKRR